jgi:hypothetical protein
MGQLSVILITLNQKGARRADVVVQKSGWRAEPATQESTDPR